MPTGHLSNLLETPTPIDGENTAAGTPMRAYRASILHTVADPTEVGVSASYEYHADGILVVEGGKIKCMGSAENILRQLPRGTEIETHNHSIIVPGFIDTHVHYPQTGVIASYGAQLLEWLDAYVFPAESEFADPAHAASVSEIFLSELLRNGTTTALVFCTSHATSVDAFFTAAERRGLRMIAGKVLMDRNAPDGVLDTAEKGYTESADLIRRWHGRGRLSYAVTPRFAITCSSEQLHAAGRLLKEHPGVYLHTHLSENEAEIAFVKELFPDYDGYLDVYDRHGLVGPRSVFAHCVHVTEQERSRLVDCGSAVAFCATSNMFLGSGLLDMKGAEDAGLRVGLGSDVGGGTSFGMFATMKAAYKVCQLRGHNFHPMKALYLATLGGARALRLDDKVGSLKAGAEADFVVLDLKATPLIEYRLSRCTSIEDKVFAFMILGDDRCVKQTVSGGNVVHTRT